MKLLVFFSGACFGSCIGILVGYLVLADELRERSQLTEAARAATHPHDDHAAQPQQGAKPMPAGAQKMVDDAKKYVARHPEDPEGWRKLAQIYGMARKWGQAAGFLDKAHALLPKDVELLVELAEARFREGDSEKAVVALREAVKLSPTHGKAGIMLAAILHEQGRDPEALVELQRLEKVAKDEKTRGRIKALRAMIESKQKKNKK